MTAAEIAVIGGGNAAAAAVRALRDRGRSVVVIANEPPTGFHIGESLSRSAEEELRRLDILDPYLQEPHLEAQSRFSIWGSAELVEDGAWPAASHHGWCLDRARFNAFLWAQAEVTPHQRINSHVERAEDEGETWLISLRGGQPVRANIILDCSGRAAVIARRQGERTQIDRLVAAYAVLPQVDGSIDPTVGSMVESIPLGWCYSVVTPDRSMVVALFTDSDLLPDKITTSIDHWKEAIAAGEMTGQRIDTAGYVLEGTPVVVDASTRVGSVLATRRWLAAGDAAVCFDPLSSHGITTALWSGRAAAEAADGILAGDAEEPDAYDTSFRSGINKYLLDRQNMYALERRFEASPFWQRRHEQVK